MSFRSFRAAAVLLTLAAAPGCASEAEIAASEGLEAFKRCDLRAAHASFSEAHDLDARPDFALAFALSDLALLAEDPAVTGLFGRLGFTGPIDTSKLWGKGGLLERLANHDSCDSVQAFLETSMPHPSLDGGEGPSFASTIDPELTLGDLRAALMPLMPRLERVATALERAAESTEGSFTLEGGCGVGSLVVQKPELLLAAATLHALRASIVAAGSYDGAISVQWLATGGVEGQEQAYADMLNQHAFRLVDPAPMAESREIADRALEDGVLFVVATRSAKTPEGAAFDWSKFPQVAAEDLETLGVAFREGLHAEAPMTVPLVQPALTLDLASFFTSPFDASGLNPPVWSVRDDGYGPYVAADTSGLFARLGERMSPNPFLETSPEFTFTSADAWNAASEGDPYGQAFNPGGRWSSAFGCQASTTEPAPSP